MRSINDLVPYVKMKAELIPLHAWDKVIEGKSRGKTPVDNEWQNVEYEQKANTYREWLKKGNVGYRLSKRELVIDFDPRNYCLDQNVEDDIASLLGFLDFNDMIETLPTVKTGSGGYHVYTLLPKDVDYRLIKCSIKKFKGVDFKKKGGYVVAVPSRHPDGGVYNWVTIAKRQRITPQLLNLLLKPKLAEGQSKEGWGAFTNGQLQTLILDKLNIHNYNNNDEWVKILMASHHATAGLGVEEFVEWSLGDSQYEDDEHLIRNRWDSLEDGDGNNIRAHTLLYELRSQGFDTAFLRAVLDFKCKPDLTLIDEENTIEHSMLKEAKSAADKIEISDIIDVPKKTNNEDAKNNVLDAAKNLSQTASGEDKMKVMRLIKAASIEDSIEAQEIIIANKVMNQSAINKRLKALDSKILDSVTEILANTTIDAVFKEGKHIITEPNRQVWVFHKTHWKPMSDEYLGKVVYSVLDTLKSKMEIEANEVALVSNAVKGIRMRTSVLSTRLFSTDTTLPVINCANGEIWINQDGTHRLKKHSYKSYQLRCLNVDFDPEAKCPLFMKTIREIFNHQLDTDDLVDYVGEVFGYTIQPYKPDANWWMFRGDGGDGKSLLVKVLNGILGDGFYSADQSLLSVGSGGGNNHINADLVGKLAVVIEELEKGKVLNDSGLKTLSENTKKTANPKHKDTFSFNYVGSLIMCCNFYPIIKDTSEGTVRRANVIPFNRQFVKAGEDDSNRLKNIIGNKKEMAGVLNFMLNGYRRYSKRGHFEPPISCIDAKNEWLCEANNVMRFIKENIIIDLKIMKPIGKATSVYRRYERWCSNSGINSKGRNNFYNDLSNVGIIKREGHGNALFLYGGELNAERIEDFD